METQNREETVDSLCMSLDEFFDEYRNQKYAYELIEDEWKTLRAEIERSRIATTVQLCAGGCEEYFRPRDMASVNDRLYCAKCLKRERQTLVEAMREIRKSPTWIDREAAIEALRAVGDDA